MFTRIIICLLAICAPIRAATFHVKGYGAIGDDKTDNTAAFSKEFNDAVLGFEELAAYVGDETVKRSPNYRGPAFERPQLLLNQEGIPTHLYAPSGVNVNGGKGSCCYLLKIHPASRSSNESFPSDR